MNLIHAIILGIIEGITEFLPVSSTGHMIIGSSLMGINKLPFTKLFTVAIQMGAILSVLVLYWKRFVDFRHYDFYIKLIIAFIPAVIFGLLFKKQIDALLENVLVVAAMLLIGGIIFLFIDKWFQDQTIADANEMNYTSSFKIGMFQVLAMVPGVSRSAATIIGGLTQNLTRKAAAEFSFFLAVPTMFGATVKSVLDYFKDGNTLNHHQLDFLIIGNILAFAVAMISIKAFINFLTMNGFKLFGYYRIIVGLTILILHFMGFELSAL